MRGYSYPKIIEKLSKSGIVPGLVTMERLLTMLERPEKDLKIVHVAGTNGKGSTLAFLASILMESGYKVGRYISPTIKCYEERFQINGEMMGREDLETYFLKIQEVSNQMIENGWPPPTIFEAETAIALMHFQKNHVDYALVEVGMGGLLDATNAMEHTDLSIITSISEDHKRMLGDTLEEIAGQKAGIIRCGNPVIMAINPQTVRKVVEEECQKKNALLTCIEREEITSMDEAVNGSSFCIDGKEYHISLPGAHQVENALTALHAAIQLRNMGADKITADSMTAGLNNTRWPGRLELLQENPPLFLDGAHNPDGAGKLAAFLQKHFTNKTIIYIMGVLGDKDYPKMLEYLMPLAKEAYVFTPQNARGLEASQLAKAMRPYGIGVHICHDVSSAVEKAQEDHPEADCFVLCGSLSFIEDYRKSLK